MTGAASPMPTAVVFDGGWVNALSAVRLLGRAGVPVLVVDHRRGSLCFHSRYATPRVSPNPVAEADRFVSWLRELGAQLDRPAPLFPTQDEHLNLIARRRGELDGAFLYPFSDWDVLGPLQNKRHQLECARAVGVPAPRTADAPTDELGFPVLVKPADPGPFKRAFGRQAFLCETREELEETFELARSFAPMVQEFIPGGDDELYTFGSYLAEDGEALGLFSGRKLRQTTPGVGTCRIGEAVWVPEVVEQGLSILRGLGFHGLSQVEFKRDPRDGAYKLMEVNPRLLQWHGLAGACGVNLPLIAYWDLLGARRPPVRQRKGRRRWAITLMATTKPALVRPPYVDAVLSLRDPKPFLSQIARVLRRR